MRPFFQALAPVGRYALAILVIAATTAGLHGLQPWLDEPIIALLYLLPVGLTTTALGLGPGLMASFCAFLAFNYFFIVPYYTLLVHNSRDLIVLVVFFIVAVAISQLVGQARSSLAEAQAREREATHLYELSTTLAGLRHADAIARSTAEHLQAVFQAAAVRLVIQLDRQAPPQSYSVPATLPAGRPAQVTPLITTHGSLGEIQLWRNASPLSASDERLLRTFASQSALALERSRLAQAEARAQALEDSDRMKSALLSSVSHELRTPLATIKAASTSLRDGAVPWETQAREELVAVIADEADHLNRLVGNLLDMSRIEAGALKPQRQWNLLSEIVGGVLGRLRRVTAAYQVSVDIPDDLPLVPVDYVQIEQVFTNLVSNSLKYAAAGTAIRISAHTEDDLVFVQVSNEGPPVPVEHLDRIFDKFYRVTAADRVTGTGLGLSICKGILEAHGGRIWAENLPRGFAFNFTLPCTWDGAAPPRPPIESDNV